MIPWRSTIVGWLVMVFGLAAPTFAAEPLALPVKFGGPFELIDHTGAVTGSRDFRGKFMLIQFGYTYCPDICPIGLDTMAAALDRLGDAAGDVQPIFITVDPARDTPEQLASFVVHFHPDLIGLTGSEADIQKVAKAFKVHRRKVVPRNADAADYMVDHGSITYLMGPDGRFVTLFPYGTTATFMAEAIKSYLDQG